MADLTSWRRDQMEKKCVLDRSVSLHRHRTMISWVLRSNHLPHLSYSKLGKQVLTCYFTLIFILCILSNSSSKLWAHCYKSPALLFLQSPGHIKTMEEIRLTSNASKLKLRKLHNNFLAIPNRKSHEQILQEKAPINTNVFFPITRIRLLLWSFSQSLNQIDGFWEVEKQVQCGQKRLYNGCSVLVLCHSLFTLLVF